jgi:hypothetical protein
MAGSIPKHVLRHILEDIQGHILKDIQAAREA